ncbi:MAG: hypothetical protein ACRDT4_24005, partial [Micromonosporaceae bacterium]
MVGHSPVRGTDELRELIRLGRYTEAVRRAGELADSPDPYVAGYTQLQKVAALFNLGHHDACSQGLDQAYEAARRVGDPVLFAEFHALAAGVAFFDEALDRSATHLVLGSRVLQRGVPDSLEVVDAYGDLAYIHSLMGFHEQAAALLDSSLAVAARLGEPAHRFSRPDIGLRRALYLDHCGQPEQATAVLRGIVREAAVAVARYGPDGLRQDNRATVRYAGARLAASGDGSDEDTGVHAAITEPLRPEGDLATAPEYAALRAYGDACCAIAAGSGAEALTILD